MDRTDDGRTGQPGLRAALLVAVLAAALGLGGCGGPAPPEVPMEMPSIVASPPEDGPEPADPDAPGAWERVASVEPAGRLFVVAPEGAPAGGIVLVHGAWGLNRHARDLARELAAAGFAVAAPDLFDGLELTTRLAHADALAAVVPERAEALLAAAADRLAAIEEIDGSPLGMVSLSGGAPWAFRFAESSGRIVALVVDSAVLGEGVVPSRAVTFRTLLVVGEADRSLDRARLEAIAQAFAAVDAPFEVARIPGAGTDLFDPRAFGYSEVARPLALERAVRFLRGNLAGARGE
ncbi:MAG: hypothetical protein D6738_09585 [Acidobacteria bacterium]|nr:MAG: hypothetical protein D6738_09585 [Acidobacteriota bacterium]